MNDEFHPTLNTHFEAGIEFSAISARTLADTIDPDTSGPDALHRLAALLMPDVEDVVVSDVRTGRVWP